MKISSSIDALDLMSVLLAYISLHNYEANMLQNAKLDMIIYDVEHKLEYQDKLLNDILKKLERGEDYGN